MGLAVTRTNPSEGSYHFSFISEVLSGQGLFYDAVPLFSHFKNMNTFIFSFAQLYIYPPLCGLPGHESCRIVLRPPEPVLPSDGADTAVFL